MSLCLAPPDDGDLSGWWRLALRAHAAGLRPDQVLFQTPDAMDLFATAPALPPARDDLPHPLTEEAVHLIEMLLLHRNEERFSLAYRLLHRLAKQPGLIGNPADADLGRARSLAKAVQRDMHKMKAFVRFRRVAGEEGERFVAWFEPEHHILAATAPFFRRRFAALHWAILSPAKSVVWDGRTLFVGPGARRADAPGEDMMEAAWTTYYAAIFNPARLKPKAMRAEMPQKYWRNLPEAQLIPRLIETAAARTASMIDAGPTEPARRIRPYRRAEA